MKLKNRVYLTAEGKAVAEGDPSAVELLFGVGHDVPEEMVKKYNLTEVGVAGSKGETYTGDTLPDSPQAIGVAQREAARASAKAEGSEDTAKASKAPAEPSKARK